MFEKNKERQIKEDLKMDDAKKDIMSQEEKEIYEIAVRDYEEDYKRFGNRFWDSKRKYRDDTISHNVHNVIAHKYGLVRLQRIIEGYPLEEVLRLVDKQNKEEIK